MNLFQQIQFLDLDDVDSQEIEYLQSVLYSLRSTHLELPWVDDVEEIQWDQHHYGEYKLTKFAFDYFLKIDA